MSQPMENTNGFVNNCLITLPGAAFLCQLQHLFCLIFSNCNNRRMTFAHAGIVLSYMKWIGEYLMALKGFDYFCSLGYKRQLHQKGK